MKRRLLIYISIIFFMNLVACSNSKEEQKSTSGKESKMESQNKDEANNINENKLWKINNVTVGMAFSEISSLIPDYAVIKEDDFHGKKYIFHFDGLQWTFTENGTLDFILASGVNTGLDDGVQVGDEASKIYEQLGEPEKKTSTFSNYNYNNYELQFYLNEDHVESVRLILRNYESSKASDIDKELLSNYLKSKNVEYIGVLADGEKDEQVESPNDVSKNKEEEETEKVEKDQAEPPIDKKETKQSTISAKNLIEMINQGTQAFKEYSKLQQAYNEDSDQLLIKLEELNEKYNLSSTFSYLNENSDSVDLNVRKLYVLGKEYIFEVNASIIFHMALIKFGDDKSESALVESRQNAVALYNQINNYLNSLMND